MKILLIFHFIYWELFYNFTIRRLLLLLQLLLVLVVIRIIIQKAHG